MDFSRPTPDASPPPPDRLGQPEDPDNLALSDPSAYHITSNERMDDPETMSDPAAPETDAAETSTAIGKPIMDQTVEATVVDEPEAEAVSSPQPEADHQETAEVRDDEIQVRINPEHPRDEVLDRVIEDLSEGLPKDREELPIRRSDRKYFGCPEAAGEVPPDYFVKVQTRPPVQPPLDRSHLDKLSPELRHRRLDIEAARSDVNHEFELAPEIQAIASSPEAQEIFRPYGLDSVSYAAPIATVTNVGAHKGATIFPWVEGKRPYAPPDPSVPSSADSLPPNAFILPDEPVQQLRELFETNGIRPTDLRHGNLLIDGSHLRIVDAQLFGRMYQAELDNGG